MSAAPTAVFQLTIVRPSCGWVSERFAPTTTGGPTLDRQRANGERSAELAGVNQLIRGEAGASSAVSRATRAWLPTHPCEAASTNKRKKKGYRRTPGRWHCQRLFKLFRWSEISIIQRVGPDWRLSCMGQRRERAHSISAERRPDRRVCRRVGSF